MIDSAGAAAATFDIREAWKGVWGHWPQAALGGAGFSFLYAGESIGTQIPNAWNLSVQSDSNRSTTATILSHDSGLVVNRKLRVFAGFDAVEYCLGWRNESAQALPAISAIDALNLSFAMSPLDEICVISSGGGLNQAVLPPDSFAIRKHVFAPSVPTYGFVHLTTEGGRSSDGNLLFFFVHNETQGAGLFIAFGWSGQ